MISLRRTVSTAIGAAGISFFLSTSASAHSSLDAGKQSGVDQQCASAFVTGFTNIAGQTNQSMSTQFDNNNTIFGLSMGWGTTDPANGHSGNALLLPTEDRWHNTAVFAPEDQILATAYLNPLSSTVSGWMSIWSQGCWEIPGSGGK